MRFLILARLIFLTILSFVVITAMLPAIILGGSQFLREVYKVLEQELVNLRSPKKKAA